MAKINASAEISQLKSSFEKAALDAKKIKFFSSWFDNNAAIANEYASYADTLGAAESLLAAKDKNNAVLELVKLKMGFDAKAEAHENQRRGFFTSWTRDFKKEAAGYRNLSKKVATILKSI